MSFRSLCLNVSLILILKFFLHGIHFYVDKCSLWTHWEYCFIVFWVNCWFLGVRYLCNCSSFEGGLSSVAVFKISLILVFYNFIKMCQNRNFFFMYRLWYMLDFLYLDSCLGKNMSFIFASFPFCFLILELWLNIFSLSYNLSFTNSTSFVSVCGNLGCLFWFILLFISFSTVSNLLYNLSSEFSQMIKF